MKIRIVKKSGKQIDLTEVAAIDIIDCRKAKLVRYDPMESDCGHFSFTFRGSMTSIYDEDAEYPLDPTILG